MYRVMAPDIDKQSPVHGDEIRRLRDARGWTQDELKNHANASLSSVQRAERSDPTLKASTARRLASALGVPVSRIYDIDEPASVTFEEAPSWFLEHIAAAEALAARRHQEVMQALGLIHDQLRIV